MTSSDGADALGEGQTNPVRYEKLNAIAVLQIDRPAARNALNLSVLTGLATALANADADPAIRCMVLTGGADVFSAGADIDMLAGHTAASYVVSANRRAFDAIRSTRKPVIAAVAGYCLGGGCEIALGCDQIVAADTAVFGQPEINLGIIPGAGGTLLWSPRAGSGAQARIALCGTMVDAFEARRLGIADRVVPAAALMPAAMELAAQIAAKAPLAVEAAKSAARMAWKAPLASALEQEVALMAGLLASEDAAEGIAAFLEKRPACFKGC
ncbi:enoyl-CoA hydratase/isomerase family protein [Rhizobium sp. SSA_523]|uniref:enoyl-CoA hydratase/isomerase family protein n=1 Tax=Rhizobium sp. SSA_523 TaxID=2952477 RepID=UPI002091A8B3|nr:enoyl-CoA hydratase-related protein [Rhizobium sp. SSA_523]MCO5731650.1 enoyl-CoA hydratase-related protein [Rhizobium sp. SSA_523]WKC21844.1 enoyl-CoA hydratase-related protein [Rhizobium sp. SSA_523]